jgi:hypothetical protein
MFRLGKKFFSTQVTKNANMELTIRTPYKTLCSKLTDFQRIITKTNEAVLVISNKMPAALHMLPPGSLLVRTGS